LQVLVFMLMLLLLLMVMVVAAISGWDAAASDFICFNKLKNWIFFSFFNRDIEID
jgi:hypothetical protein